MIVSKTIYLTVILVHFSQESVQPRTVHVKTGIDKRNRMLAPYQAVTDETLYLSSTCPLQGAQVLISERECWPHTKPPQTKLFTYLLLAPFKVRGELERQVEDFSARLRRLELDLRAGQEETRVLKHDAEEAHKKADILEVAKVLGNTSR